MTTTAKRGESDSDTIYSYHHPATCDGGTNTIVDGVGAEDTPAIGAQFWNLYVMKQTWAYERGGWRMMLDSMSADQPHNNLAVVGFLVVAGISAMLYYYYHHHHRRYVSSFFHNKLYVKIGAKRSSSSIKKSSTMARCPFSQVPVVLEESSLSTLSGGRTLLQATHTATKEGSIGPRSRARHPLELFREWTFTSTTSSNDQHRSHKKKPLAARWLNAGLSGHDTPGRLRMGLHRLDVPKDSCDANYFLVQDDHDWELHAQSLLCKQDALNQNQSQSKSHATNRETANQSAAPSVVHDGAHNDMNKTQSSDQFARRSSKFKDSCVWVAEPESLLAQQECLELWIEYLSRHYPKLYQYNPNTRTILVASTQQTFAILDWWNTCPLELCARLVQEDLILLRPGQSSEQRQEQQQEQEQPEYFMAAAAVVHSFEQLEERLGQPMQFIHQPVPGFDQDLLKAVNMTLHSTLKQRQDGKNQVILWRNNWGVVPKSEVPFFAHQDECAPASNSSHHVGKSKSNNNQANEGGIQSHSNLKSAAVDDTLQTKETNMAECSRQEPVNEASSSSSSSSSSFVQGDELSTLFLEVEYQTLRRLSKSNYVLFTVKTMWDPITTLATVPQAAACLAASIRGRSAAFLKYKGLDSQSLRQSVLTFLDRISSSSSSSTDN